MRCYVRELGPVHEERNDFHPPDLYLGGFFLDE